MPISPIQRQAALGILGQILTGIDKAYLGFSDVVEATITGAANAENQLRDFEHFDFNPKFKTRVISVPFAIGGAEDLWDTIKFEFINKLKEIRDDSETIVKAIQHIPPRSPGEPIMQRAALMIEFIHTFNSDLARIIKRITDLTQMIDDIKHRIETLDDIFLSQARNKKTVDLHYRKRVGV
jgi:hypothetical protein